MKYDFDKVIDRRPFGSLKWNVKPGEIPLWIADMDFEAPPCILKALEKQVNHGIFGYSIIPDEWAESYISWWKRRHNFEIKSEWLIFCRGIVPSISSCVRKLTTPGEKVLLMTPSYNNFFNSIVNNGRFVKESPLAFDGKNYSIDFERLEEDLKDPQVSLMILCNPQNPTGNIWSREELCKIGDLCKKHGVTVISDEIHCDFTIPGKSYVPFASASETCKNISINCVSPGKCFNIAGLNTAAVFVADPFLRHKVWRSLNTDECAEPNVFAVGVAIAAFNEGEDWVNQFNEYMFKNRKIAEDFIRENIPSLTAVHGEATYLLWVKLPDGTDGNDFTKRLRESTGLYINAGNVYGKTGENFVRINLACPESLLRSALQKLMEFQK